MLEAITARGRYVPLDESRERVHVVGRHLGQVRWKNGCVVASQDRM